MLLQYNSLVPELEKQIGDRKILANLCCDCANKCRHERPPADRRQAGAQSVEKAEVGLFVLQILDILLGRNGRRGAIANGIGNLSHQLSSNITAGKNTLD